MTDTPAADMPALAGWAMNHRAPVAQRLAAAKQALTFYVDRADALEQLLTHLEKKADSAEFSDYEAMYARPAYRDIADRLRRILDGLPEDVPDGQ